MTSQTAAIALARMAAAERRLAEHAARPLPAGLTDPDPGASERWEAGQVWAHLAEFPGYWHEQVRKVAAASAAGNAEPLPFGRTKTDAGRIAGIERERRTDPAELLRRVTAEIGAVSATLTGLPDEVWEARGVHPSRGEMTVSQIVDRFILGHLEEHADQLDGLELVTIEEIRAAAERIRGVALQPPLLLWDDRTWLKPESLQPVGAFKMRGAYNAVASLTDEERARGVVTYSSGNHAQAVARAARLLGAQAVIVMPEDAPPVKVEGVRRDGAEIVVAGRTGEERHAVALELVERDGRVMIEPYDDRRIIAGQGTCGLEIAEEMPDVTSVLIPVSGGGLSAGIATAVKALAPNARVIGVEPELAADAQESLAKGEIVRWDGSLTTRTMADGLRVEHLGWLPFLHLRRFMDEIVTVSEEQMADAMRQLATRARLVVEASGAAGMAAHLSGAAPQPAGDDHRVIVISGGNVDPAAFAEILRG
ncbi:MAG TPA: threonine/serine dehydratase [Candidatus Limnocylindria bacterium]|jgi:threonine dehydratase|nr:threonine/serine dehydratase [Candidatus Limnocylindria bacterium]